MKKFTLLALISFSTITSANCTYFLDSKLSSSDKHINGFHYELESALSNKGYSKVRKMEEAKFIVTVENKVEMKTKDNFFTALKDMFDSDSEADYFIKYSNKTSLTIKDSLENIKEQNEKVSKGETVDYINHLNGQLASESVKEAALLAAEIEECRE